MEHELWSDVVRAVRAAAVGHRERQRKFSDVDIVLTWLWAVQHDRPVLWATDPRNWSFYLRIKSRPSASTMSRRLRTASVRALIERVQGMLTPTPNASVSLIIDAKPLPIGGYTNDRDATTGRACGCFAYGYKLFLILDETGGIHAWKVAPMNHSEQAAAMEMIPVAARSAGTDRWLLGDKIYDSVRLYDHADAHGLKLLAPRIQRGAGPGPTQTPARRRSLDLMEPPGNPKGAAVMDRRDAIERYLGTLCTVGGGLSPLPGYVRGVRRVTLWVGAKLLLHTIRLRCRRRRAA